jgi:hypothetical protein
MIKWQVRLVRIGIVVGAIASFAIASGAGLRWS